MQRLGGWEVGRLRCVAVCVVTRYEVLEHLQLSSLMSWSPFLGLWVLWVFWFYFVFLMKASLGVLMVAQRVKYLTRILKDERSIPGLAQWVKGSVLP